MADVKSNGKPRIGIYGAGCIGLYVGGRLLQSGKADVAFVGRPRMEQTLRKHGLVISSYNKPQPVTFDFKELCWGTDISVCLKPKPVDYLIVTVKCDATSGDAISELSQLPRDVPIISLQNGIDNTRILQERLPQHNVLPAMVGFNVAELEGGVMCNTISGKLAFDNRVGAAFGELMRTHVSMTQLLSTADMTRVQWGKLTINLLNAINALAGIPTVQMMLDPAYRMVAAAAQEEALAVLAAAKIETLSGLAIPIPPTFIPHILRWPNALYMRAAKSTLKMDARAKSSMLQDLEHGRSKTEIDQLNGTIVKLGEKHGVSTPVNAKICELIRAAEKAAAGSPKLTGTQLLAEVRSVYPKVDESYNQQQLIVLIVVVVVLLYWFLLRK